MNSAVRVPCRWKSHSWAMGDCHRSSVSGTSKDRTRRPGSGVAMSERFDQPETWVTFCTGHMGNTFPLQLQGEGGDLPWKESVMDERLRFVARLLEGEPMSHVCREFGISRKTGYKIFGRCREHGLEALTDRSRRPVRYANQLPSQIETAIVPAGGQAHWGARKIQETLVRRLARSAGSGSQHHPCGFGSARAESSVPSSAVAPRALLCRSDRRPTICGAPITRASSSSATSATATL